MPAIQSIKTEDGLFTDSASSRSIIEMDEEEKYWKLKLLYSALSSVLFSDVPDPRLTPETLNYLRKSFQDPGFPPEKHDLMTAEIKSIIQENIGEEIQKVCDTLVDNFKEFLRNSISVAEEDDAKERLEGVRKSGNPLDEVLKHFRGLKEEETEVDKKILEAMEIRTKEILELEESLTKVRPVVEKVMRLVALQKQPERINKRMEILRRKSDFLAGKVQEAKREQIALENPPEVIRLRSETMGKLALAKNQLKSENDKLSDFLQTFDNLEPDVKALMNQLRSTEEAIERQQWILNRMKGFKEAEDSFGADADIADCETFF